MRREESDCCCLLFEEMSGLLEAAQQENLKEVKKLLREGANVNEKNEVSELLTYYYCFILLFVVVG